MTPDITPLISKDQIRRGGPVRIATQIANLIRNQILAGELQTGDFLPGEQALADQLGCNRDRVKDAYRELAEAGYVITRHRASSQVRKPPPARSLTNERYRDVVEAIRGGTFEPASVGFCVDYQCTWDEFTARTESSIDTASDEVRERLELPRAGKVLIRHLVESARGVPVQIRRSVMPAWLAKGTEVAKSYRQPWPGGTVGELMSLNYEPVRVVENWLTRQPTADEAATLLLWAGMPVWEATRTFYVLAGRRYRPLETSTLVLLASGSSLRLVTNI